MTSVEGWRLERRNHDGDPMPPMDYTDRRQALQHLDATRRTGAFANLLQWNQFTGEWQDTGL